MTEIMMKALQLIKDSPDQPPKLIQTSLPKPQIQDGFVLVKVTAAGIQPSDVINAQGKFPFTTYPRVPGRDFAGIIVDGPPESLNLEVYGTSGEASSFTRDGSHAEYVLVEKHGVAPKPKYLSWAQAASIGVPWTTAYIALKRAQVISSDIVLVMGSNGAVGAAATQLAADMGCKVLTAARRGPADVNLTEDPKMSKATELTGGNGPDIILDTTGNVDVLQAALAILAVRGRLTYISGAAELNVNLGSLYRNEQSIIGSNSIRYGAVGMAQAMMAMSMRFNQGGLKPPAEESLHKISLEEAIQVYSEKCDKKHIIVFG
jgi:NADPH2:quinone reductase